jgi:hypothetical protein
MRLPPTGAVSAKPPRPTRKSRSGRRSGLPRHARPPRRPALWGRPKRHRPPPAAWRRGPAARRPGHRIGPGEARPPLGPPVCRNPVARGKAENPLSHQRDPEDPPHLEARVRATHRMLWHQGPSPPVKGVFGRACRDEAEPSPPRPRVPGRFDSTLQLSGILAPAGLPESAPCRLRPLPGPRISRKELTACSGSAALSTPARGAFGRAPGAAPARFVPVGLRYPMGEPWRRTDAGAAPPDRGALAGPGGGNPPPRLDFTRALGSKDWRVHPWRPFTPRTLLWFLEANPLRAAGPGPPARPRLALQEPTLPARPGRG